MTVLTLYNEINYALDHEEGVAELPVHVLVHGPDNTPHLYRLSGKVLVTTDEATGKRVVVIG